MSFDVRPKKLIFEDPLSDDYLSTWSRGPIAELERLIDYFVTGPALFGVHPTQTPGGDVLVVPDNIDADDIYKIVPSTEAITTHIAAGATGADDNTFAARCDDSGRLTIIAGPVDSLSGAVMGSVYRFNSDGTLESTTAGVGSDLLQAVAIHPDGSKVYAVTSTFTTLTLSECSLPGGSWSPVATRPASWTGFHQQAGNGLGVHSDGSILWAYGHVEVDEDVNLAYHTHFLDRLDASGATIWQRPLSELDVTTALVSGLAGPSLNGMWPLIVGDADGEFWGWEKKITSAAPGTYFLKIMKIPIDGSPVTRYDYYDSPPSQTFFLPIWPCRVAQFPGLSKFSQSDLSDQRFFQGT